MYLYEPSVQLMHLQERCQTSAGIQTNKTAPTRQGGAVAIEFALSSLLLLSLLLVPPLTALGAEDAARRWVLVAAFLTLPLLHVIHPPSSTFLAKTMLAGVVYSAPKRSVNDEPLSQDLGPSRKRSAP